VSRIFRRLVGTSDEKQRGGIQFPEGRLLQTVDRRIS
jgi:hypothetical protein